MVYICTHLRAGTTLSSPVSCLSVSRCGFSPGHNGKIQDLDLGMGSRVSPSGFNLAYRSASQRLGPISQPMAVFSIHRLHQGTHRLEYSWMRAGLELFWSLEDTIKINNNHILFFPACNSPSRNQFSYMYHGCS